MRSKENSVQRYEYFSNDMCLSYEFDSISVFNVTPSMNRMYANGLLFPSNFRKSEHV